MTAPMIINPLSIRILLHLSYNTAMTWTVSGKISIPLKALPIDKAHCRSFLVFLVSPSLRAALESPRLSLQTHSKKSSTISTFASTPTALVASTASGPAVSTSGLEALLSSTLPLQVSLRKGTKDCTSVHYPMPQSQPRSPKQLQ